MKYISLKVLLIAFLVGFSLISCGDGSSGSKKKKTVKTDQTKVPGDKSPSDKAPLPDEKDLPGNDADDEDDGDDGNGDDLVNPSPIIVPTCEINSDASIWTALYDVAGLKAIGKDKTSMAGKYCLADDIDLSEDGGDSGFPLGWNIEVVDILAFTGDFDGEGHTISNLKIEKDISYGGLFSILTGNSQEGSFIKNLKLSNFNVTCKEYIGALTGFMNGKVTLSNVNVVDSDISASFGGNVGGLVGKINDYVVITDSSVVGGSVACMGYDDYSGAAGYIGGLVGNLFGFASIDNSYASTAVYGTNVDQMFSTGGLVGKVFSDNIEKPTITRSYATGAVIGSSTIGGLVGSLVNGIVTDSYATGSVTGDKWVGGLIGLIDNGEVTNNYATGLVKAKNEESLDNPGEGGLIGRLRKSECSKPTNSCIITNSYFDLTTTSSLNAIGNKDDFIIDIHSGVSGVADIITKIGDKFYSDSGSTAIFDGWDAAVWEITAKKWPTLQWQSLETSDE